MSSILIVEDHSLMADSLAAALGADGYAVMIAPLTTRTLVLEVAADYRPSIVLLDLELGGEVGSGLELIAPLARLGSQVVVVSGTQSRLDFGAALEQGAVGYLPKGRPLAELLTTVRTLAHGRPVLAEDERHRLLGEVRLARSEHKRALEPFGRLTRREQAVLRGLLDGRRADDLARSTSVAPSTIRTHLRGVLTKLGVTSQLEAVAAARRVGWPPTH